jgi:hypothetical protein
VPRGPFAVVVTNDQRTGTTYEVMLINDQAQIVAHVAAALPGLQPNQTLSLPLVSASDTRVYYLNGNTDVDSLSPSGATATATQITDGSSMEVAFAVDPESQRIAIAEISEETDGTDDTGEGYVENLSGGGSPVTLWQNDGSYALRWPAGWAGTSLIDYITSGMGQQCGGDCGSEEVNSYHVVDPTTGDATATVCQTPASQPSYGTPNATITSDSLDGLPTAAGTACEVFADSYDGNGRYSGETDSVEAVDWTGTATSFIQFPTNQGGNNELYGCFLSPDGSRMACTAGSNNALALLSSGGTITNTGHQYANILGWIDATHLLVDVDSGDLGVLDPDTGVLTSVAVPQANQVSMAATLPGAL